MKFLKKQAWNLLRSLRLSGYVILAVNSGLKKAGWFQSYDQRASIDASGQPLPWLTYAFIRFLEPRLSPDLTVFEYGAGSSTLWFARRVKRVCSVEHSEVWFRKVQDGMPHQVELIHAPEASYAQAIRSFAQNRFDIILVDGIDRNNCLREAASHLSERGVIILDNSDRPDYQPGIDYCLEQGMKRLDFIGMTPAAADFSATSLLYRPGNCLQV